MEGLLAPEVLGDGRAPGRGRFDAEWASGGEEVVAAAALPNDRYLNFSYNRADCVPGVRIHRIPLAHPRDVPIILSAIRQQVAFNTLFSSCFATADYVSADANLVLPGRIEVVVVDAPGFMHFGVFDPEEDGMFTFAVTVGPGGALEASIRGTNGKPYPCSNRKAAALLKVARNVPLTLEAIRRVAQSTQAAGYSPAGPIVARAIAQPAGSSAGGGGAAGSGGSLMDVKMPDPDLMMPVVAGGNMQIDPVANGGDGILSAGDALLGDLGI
jgi:hypothetical protein